MAKHKYNNIWKPWQLDYLREWYGKKPIWKIARYVRHSKDACKAQAWKHGFAPKRALRYLAPDRYIEIMTDAALEAGIRPAIMFRYTRAKAMQHARDLRNEIWARLHAEGYSYPAIGR